MLQLIEAAISSLTLLVVAVAAMLVVDPVRGYHFMPPLAVSAFAVGILALVVGQM